MKILKIVSIAMALVLLTSPAFAPVASANSEKDLADSLSSIDFSGIELSDLEWWDYALLSINAQA